MLDALEPPLIFGPAYLDRVVRVDRPLVDPALGVVRSTAASTAPGSKGGEAKA